MLSIEFFSYHISLLGSDAHRDVYMLQWCAGVGLARPGSRHSRPRSVRGHKTVALNWVSTHATKALNNARTSGLRACLVRKHVVHLLESSVKLMKYFFPNANVSFDTWLAFYVFRGLDQVFCYHASYGIRGNNDDVINLSFLDWDPTTFADAEYGSRITR